MISCRSPQYRGKSMAPRTEPWGTSHTMEPGDEVEDPTRTCCSRFGIAPCCLQTSSEHCLGVRHVVVLLYIFLSCTRKPISSLQSRLPWWALSNGPLHAQVYLYILSGQLSWFKRHTSRSLHACLFMHDRAEGRGSTPGTDSQNWGFILSWSVCE